MKDAGKVKSYNFFDTPVNAKLPGDKSILIKADVLYQGAGGFAIGGWASYPLQISLEANGKEVALQKNVTHFRQDVNEALGKNDDIARAFALLTDAPEPDKELALVCVNKELSLSFRLPFSREKATSSIEPSFHGVLGANVYEALQRKIRRNSRLTFSRAGQIDHAVRLTAPGYDECVVIFGWLAMPDDSPLYAGTADHKIKVGLTPYFWPRADIEAGKGPLCNESQNGHGFFAAFKGLPSSMDELNIWSGDNAAPLASCVIEDVITFREFLKVVFDLPIPWSELAACYEKTLQSLLSGLQTQHVANLKRRPIIQGSVGDLPKNPEISVIIPLYGNLKFLTDQIMAFSEDPVFQQNAELIYVIDDCSLLDNFKIKAEELNKLFAVPFRWVSNGSNQGFSQANNLGASISKGKYLVFMNSDVFPESAGWLTAFKDHLENNPDTGIAGCLLLAPSGVIQHGGMDFLFKECLGIWTNIHPEAGCDPCLLDESQSEKPAVTGACVALRREFFDKLGGWSTDYLVGDFEDSDLCFRARELGKKVRCLSQIPLVHLERQTFKLWEDESVRQRMTIFNAMLHQCKWKNLLEISHIVMTGGYCASVCQ